MEPFVNSWIYSPDLKARSRLAWVIDKLTRKTLWSFLVLGIGGCLAALAWQRVRLGIGIPGHGILKAALPMGLAFALVPYRGAGTFQSLLAGALTFVIPAAPGEGNASRASLIILGPLIDLSLAWGTSYLLVRFTLAGLVANLIALLVRWFPDLASGHISPRVFSIGWWTYPFCGLVAGLLLGLVACKTKSASSGKHGIHSGN